MANPPRGMTGGQFVLVRKELRKLVERRAAGKWINELARRAAPRPVLVCMTRQRSDLAGPWGKALLDNSTMQLFLRQSPEELAYLRDALKLTDAEVAQIVHLKTDKRRAAQAYLINGTRERHGVGAAWPAGVLDLHVGPDRGSSRAGGVVEGSRAEPVGGSGAARASCMSPSQTCKCSCPTRRTGSRTRSALVQVSPAGTATDA